MNGEERVFANLRLLGEVDKNQFIRVTSSYNIRSIENNTVTNNIISCLYFDLWGSTRECLKKLFVDDVPKLRSKLINQNMNEELVSLRILLIHAITGVNNMMEMWSDISLRVALLKTYVSDYGYNNIHKIESYLDEHKINYVHVSSKKTM